MTLFAFLTLSVLAGNAITRAFEMHIPFSPCSAATQHEFLPISREIGNWSRRLLRIRCWTFVVGRSAFFFLVEPHHRPHRNLHDFVHARASAHFFTHPMPAVFRLD